MTGLPPGTLVLHDTTRDLRKKADGHFWYCVVVFKEKETAVFLFEKKSKRSRLKIYKDRIPCDE